MPILTRDEFAYIDWIRKRTPAHPRVRIGPGDDTAAIQVSGDRSLLITTDMLLEGSCFLLDQAGPRSVGRKAMAVNLSDIAAMAGIPTAAVVSVGLPRQNGRAIAEQLHEGLHEMAKMFDVPIVGGDTNSWTGGLVVTVTLLGEATAKGPVTRAGAKPGDWIFVTGPLGGSILGKHLDFVPRVKEALALHQWVDLHAMIDISDGLSADLHHLCEESRCGAVIRSESVPITASARILAERTGRTPLQHALTDGEDFELIFTVAPEDGQRLLDSQPIEGIQLVHLGEMISAGYWIEENGERKTLEVGGYVHHLESGFPESLPIV